MTDPNAPDEPDAHDCECSRASAQHLHELVAGVAESRGIDVCNPYGDTDGGGSGMDTSDEATDLRLIHDTLVEQGARCTGEEGEDDEDMFGGDAADVTGDGPDVESRFRPKK